MDIRKVKKLIEMLEESAIDEIEIHEDKDSVRVSRNQHAPVQAAARKNIWPPGTMPRLVIPAE